MGAMHNQQAAEADTPTTLTPAVNPVRPWRVAKVQALDGYGLRVQFNDGRQGTVNMTPLITSERAGVFAVLQDPAEFLRATVVHGAVTWPCGLDLAPDAMYHGILEGNGGWTP